MFVVSKVLSQKIPPVTIPSGAMICNTFYNHKIIYQPSLREIMGYVSPQPSSSYILKQNYFSNMKEYSCVTHWTNVHPFLLLNASLLMCLIVLMLSPTQHDLQNSDVHSIPSSLTKTITNFSRCSLMSYITTSWFAKVAHIMMASCGHVWKFEPHRMGVH